jgi:hypothetical protein
MKTNPAKAGLIGNIYFLIIKTVVMATTYKIKLTYMRASDKDLPDIARQVRDSMTGKDHFANPPVSMADLGVQIDEFEAIRSLAKLDGREKGPKNDKRDLLRQSLHLTAAYVVGVAKNDLSILESSGFTITKSRGANSPGNILITTTGEGQVTSTMKPVRGARMYIHQYTTDPTPGDKAWQDVSTTKNKYKYTNLATGVRHFFRVKAVLKDDQAIISNQESMIVQ